MKRFYLTVELGLFQKSIYPMEGSAIIGRSSRSDIAVSDLTISSSHARVSYQKGNWVIEDLGSTNGLIFAGERISKKIMHPGDTFQIGKSTLHFIEKDVLEDAHHLSNTIRAFTEFLSHPSSQLESCNTELGFTTLKDTLLSTQIFNSVEDAEFSKLEAAANLHLLGADQLVIREGLALLKPVVDLVHDGLQAFHLPVMPGAREVIRSLGNRCTLGLASGSHPRLIQATLDATEWRKDLSEIVSGDDVKRGKPAPDIYLEITRRLQVPVAETAVLEDSANGILAGCAAGVKVIAVPNTHIRPPQDVINKADVVIESLLDFSWLEDRTPDA